MYSGRRQGRARAPAADGVRVVQARRIEVRLGDAGLIELHAERHHRLVGAHAARREGQRREVPGAGARGLGACGLHLGGRGAEPGVLGPGGADCFFDCDGLRLGGARGHRRQREERGERGADSEVVSRSHGPWSRPRAHRFGGTAKRESGAVREPLPALAGSTRFSRPRASTP